MAPLLGHDVLAGAPSRALWEVRAELRRMDGSARLPTHEYESATRGVDAGGKLAFVDVCGNLIQHSIGVLIGRGIEAAGLVT